MKILWVSPFFLHPTDRGAQIRSLGTLKQLHRRHEIHFAALANPLQPEGPARGVEYSSFQYPIEHRAPPRDSFGFLPQLAQGVFSPLPLAVSRYYSLKLLKTVEQLWSSQRFDCLVCDFLAAAPNIPQACLPHCVLFQHNVETTIWERHTEQAPTAVHRAFFSLQARRMRAYEGLICCQSAHVIAVSDLDATRFKEMFGIQHVSSVPTGVDVDYFAQGPEIPPPVADLVFTGSMDWLPNVDGIRWFALEILPIIRRSLPECTVAVVGRNPDPRVSELADQIPGLIVTGTVPDIRPYLWGSKVAIVPLRIGGGTRLKIYESMAAGIPTISTTIGAEGLTYTANVDIKIADAAQAFAASCVELLENSERRRELAEAALQLVRREFSWETVAGLFSGILEQRAAPRMAVP